MNARNLYVGNLEGKTSVGPTRLLETYSLQGRILPETPIPKAGEKRNKTTSPPAKYCTLGKVTCVLEWSRRMRKKFLLSLLV